MIIEAQTELILNIHRSFSRNGIWNASIREVWKHVVKNGAQTTRQ